MLPTRVLNTLNLGRPVAVELEPPEAGWRAWLFVRPVIGGERTWDALRSAWTLAREAERSFEPPSGFIVRYTRLSEAHLEAEEQGDLDLAMRADPPEDWIVLAPSIDSLEQVLRRFLPDFDILRLPGDVDYPDPPLEFARKRSLDDILGAA